MFEDKDLDKMMAESETPQEQLNKVAEDVEVVKAENLSESNLPDKREEQGDIVSPATYNSDYIQAVEETQKAIIDKAKEKINDDKMIEKHSDNIAKITDKALTVQAEQEDLKIEEKKADNKVKKQEIKNRLIVLKAEAIRLEKEQQQLNKEQKEDHKRRNKEAKWEVYGKKLEKMKYDYVPNAFILSMLIFFDGIVSFFNGLGAVSTSIVKALKWVLIIGGIVILLMIVPVTREWLLNLLKFK